MARPTPIVWFERLYLASLGLRVATAVALWRIADAGAIQIGLIVGLLLWFGVMYRHSRVAAVLVGVLFLLVGLWTLRLMVAAQAVTPVAAVYLVALTLHAAAIACLLHDSAAPWFRRPPADPAT